MNITVYTENHKYINPNYNILSKLIKDESPRYEISMQFLKSRIKSDITRILYKDNIYHTKNGGILKVINNKVYLFVSDNIKSLKDIYKLENIMDKSRDEIIGQYPTYPNNIKKIEIFNKIKGIAWKNN